MNFSDPRLVVVVADPVIVIVPAEMISSIL
jgi:hypothetical protein